MAKLTFPAQGSATQTGGYRGDIGWWRTTLRGVKAHALRSPKSMQYFIAAWNALLVNLAVLYSTVTNAQALNISNSANTKTVAGTLAVTGAGVVSANTPATAAIVTSAQALTGVTPTGTYTTTVTFTVALGVITAIVLS